MEIRLAQTSDAAGIAAIHAAAFANLGCPRSVPIEVSLVDWLRADGDVIADLSFVAVHNERQIGHVLSSRGHIGQIGAVAVGPLGVLPEWQRRGVGGALMAAVVAAADALGEVAVVLLGDPASYSRFGFVPATDHGVEPPDPAWAEHFQLRCLSAWSPDIAGTFRYPPAFDRL